MFKTLRSKVISASGIAIVCSLMVANPAISQVGNTESQTLMNKLNQLDNQVQTLSRYIYKNNPDLSALESAAKEKANPAPSNRALVDAFDNRMSEMQSQLSGLTGQIERLQFEVRSQNQKIETYKTRIDFLERQLNEATVYQQNSQGNVPISDGTVQVRGDVAQPFATPLQEQENQQQDGSAQAVVNPIKQSQDTPNSATIQANVASGVAPQVSEQGQAAANNGVKMVDQTSQTKQDNVVDVPQTQDQALTTGNAASDYDQAFSLLKSQNYEAAEAAFSSFVGSYPDSELAPNARYWLAETFYVRGDFAQASKLFAEAFQSNPNGPKAADNLLKLGMSLEGLGKVKESCVTYSEISKRFPNASASLLQRARQQLEKNKCAQ